MWVAEHGIRSDGYLPPDAKELRRIMRLFVSSARRGRQGEYSVSFTLRRRDFLTANRYVGMFVLDRLELKELTKS